MHLHEVEIVIQPTTCVKLTCQECCLDTRCAMPHDKEVPCIISCFGIQCMKDYKFDCKFGERLGDSSAGVRAKVQA